MKDNTEPHLQPHSHNKEIIPVQRGSQNKDRGNRTILGDTFRNMYLIEEEEEEEETVDETAIRYVTGLQIF